MKLHHDQTEFKDVVQAASEHLAIREVFIEKDYWVSLILKNLSESALKDKVVFKGGTSLSKAHKLIDRFSEDIDLAVVKDPSLTGNQIKNLISKIEKDIVSDPFTVDADFKSSKGSKFRKTGYRYPRIVEASDYGHATDRIILEINSFANPSPCRLIKIQSYVGEFLSLKNQDTVKTFELAPFEVLVLNIERTFVEKLMGLARISIIDDSEWTELKSRIRHFYDIFKLLDSGKINTFIESLDFEAMVNDVRSDDCEFEEFKSHWGSNKLIETPLFTRKKDIFEKIENTFANDLSSLLTAGEKTQFSDIVKVFKTIEKHIHKF